jgi:hypothetical protein
MITLLFVVLLVVALVAAELTGIKLVLTTAGVLGIIAGALAFYIGMGQVINDVYGRKVFAV